MERTITAGEFEIYRNRAQIIIDARSPGEFNEDHIPGAVNVPMLDNEQRAEIGTLHRENVFEARKLGAMYAVEAIRQFLDSDLIRNAKKNTAMLIYCARGGMRSGSLATVLAQIGFTVFRLDRGYKAYRAYVLDKLKQPLPGPVHVLYGYTGSSKTRVLQALASKVNVLDLEGCARHRGSLLGDLIGVPQPTQRGFESALADTVQGFDPRKPTLLEGESRKIGKVNLNDGLWQQLKKARPLWLEIPRSQRVAFILRDYHDLMENPDVLARKFERLSRYLPKARTAELQELLENKSWPLFVERLLEWHYDPLYGRRRKDPNLHVIEADSLDAAVTRVAEAIGTMVE
ncbi:MAG: tRNA 2-selenouridine(34) synthase MnmH [Acidobacteriota bacterium]|nr:tRNA 2-selenouridine(34) synthase MnmH [Acidobacteriota bacterium]